MSAESLLFLPREGACFSAALPEMETLRTVVTERMAAAVDEILGVFGQTVVRYREMIELQRLQLEEMRGQEPIQTWVKPSSDESSVKNQSEQTGGMDTTHTHTKEEKHTHSIDTHTMDDTYAHTFEDTYTQRTEDTHTHFMEEKHTHSIDPTHAHTHSIEPTHTDFMDDTHTHSMDDTHTHTMEDTAAFHIKTEAESEPEAAREDGRPLTDGSGDENFIEDNGEYWKHPVEAWTPAETDDAQGHSSLKPATSSAAFSCKVCSECFDSSMSLLTHSAAHPTDCAVCGKHMELTHSMKRHLRRHRERESGPVCCAVCGKAFSLRTNLLAHMKIHSGEKPHACTLCGKSFIQRSTLMQHIRSHTGEKPHTCPYCGRGFVQKGNLNLHLRMHTGEKPYECSHCGKRFAHRSNLHTHPCRLRDCSTDGPKTLS